MNNEIVFSQHANGQTVARFKDRIDYVGHGNSELEAKEALMASYMKDIGFIRKPIVQTVTQEMPLEQIVEQQIENHQPEHDPENHSERDY